MAITNSNKTKLPPGSTITDPNTQELMTDNEYYMLLRAGAASDGNVNGNASLFGGGAAGCVVEGPNVSAFRVRSGGLPIPPIDNSAVQIQTANFAAGTPFTDLNGVTVPIP